MHDSAMSSVFDLSHSACTTFGLVFTLCILVQRFFFSGSSLLKKQPPSPWFQLPIVGHLHLMDPDLRKCFRRFRKQLGDIFRLKLGKCNCIVICGYEKIQDILVTHGDVLTKRAVLPLAETITRGAGIAFANGHKWKEHRHFTLKTLKDLGMGKTFLEKKIHEEINIFLDAVKAKVEKPFNPTKLIQTNVANIICYMLFRSTFQYGDKQLTMLLDAFEENLKSGVVVGIVNFVPCLAKIPGDLFYVHKMVCNYNDVFRYVKDIVNEHIEVFDPDNITDFVGAYVKILKEQETSATQTSFSFLELCATVCDLFIAGTESTSTALRWSLPLLASYPDIQTRMFTEIKQQVGTDRLPALQDKNNLPYVEACYMEVLRFITLIPTGLPRSVLRDVDFHGYHISTNDLVFIDMQSVLDDKAVWTDPETFRPERFLDDKGRLLKTDEFIAFSLGKRNCLGEGLARMELLLFLSTIVQKFEILCPEGVDLSMNQIDGEFGLML